LEGVQEQTQFEANDQSQLETQENVASEKS